MLDELLHRMRGYSPHLLQTTNDYPQAAVLVPITRSDEPEVVLTLRASGLSPPAVSITSVGSSAPADGSAAVPKSPKSRMLVSPYSSSFGRW